MFKQLGAILLSNIPRDEEKKAEVKPSTIGWEKKVIEWALQNLKGLELRMFTASLREDDSERKRALERANLAMLSWQDDRAQATIDELLGKPKS